MQLSKNTTNTYTHTYTPGSLHAQRTEGVTGSERREDAYEVGGRIGVGGGNVDGKMVSEARTTT